MEGRALIIGGGIAGLATGRALLASGWDVQIRERAEGLPDAGTALGMWPEAMAALDRLGIGEGVREQAQSAVGGRILRPDGATIATIATAEPVYLIPRPALHRLLHDRLLEEAMTWGAKVTDLSDADDVDLVVGADGIHSLVREAIAGKRVATRPLGTVAFRGVVPGPVGDVTESWGKGRLFGITPHDDENTNWFAAVRADLLPGRDDHGSDADLLRRLYVGWHPAVAAVLDQIEEGGVDRRRLSDLAPLRSYVRGNLAIVGDAAHAMAPNAGRGACEALIDAVALADALRTADSVATGLLRYDATRRRASRRVVALSRLMNGVATMKRAIGIRNAVVKVGGRIAAAASPSARVRSAG